MTQSAATLETRGPEFLSHDEDENPVKKIEKALEKFMNDAAIEKLELEYIGLTGSQIVWDLTSFDGIGPEHVAAQLFERARDDARAQRGSARYKLVGYRQGSSKPMRLGWFTLAGGGYDLGGLEESEGPNGPGLLAQMMRHTEATTRMAYMHTRELIVDMRRELTEARQMNRHMLQNQFKVVEAHERLLNEQTKRDIDMRKAKFDEIKQEKVFEQLMVLLPVALRHMADASGSAALKDSALEQTLRALIGSMTPPQVQAIMKNLNEAQMVAFMDLYNSLAKTHPKSVDEAIKDKDKKEAEAKAKAEADLAAVKAKAEAEAGQGAVTT